MCYLHTPFKAQITINHCYGCDTQIMPILLIHCPLHCPLIHCPVQEGTKTLLYLHFLLLQKILISDLISEVPLYTYIAIPSHCAVQSLS